MSVFSLMLVVFSLTTGEFVIVGILPDVAVGVSVSVPDAGLLVTAYAIGMIFGGPTVTVLTARSKRKRLIVGLIAVSVLGNLASAMAPGYAVLLVARFVAGLVVATFFAVAVATALAGAPAGRQASTVAKVALGMNLGIIIGAPLGTAIGQYLGWRATFATVAALSVVALVLVLRYVRPTSAPVVDSALDELRVFTDREVQLALALTAIGNVGVIMIFTFIAPLLTEVSGFAAGTVPLLLLVYGAGAVLGNFCGGWLSDRFLMPSLVFLLVVLTGFLVLFWFLSPFPVPAAILTFALGAGAFAIIPGMQTRVVSTASAAPTLAVAVNASGFQVAAAFAGWLGGRVIDSRLGLPSLYLVAAVLTTAGLGIAVHSLRRDRRSAPAPASPHSS